MAFAEKKKIFQIQFKSPFSHHHPTNDHLRNENHFIYTGRDLSLTLNIQLPHKTNAFFLQPTTKHEKNCE
jgi:hypothetical protein